MTILLTGASGFLGKIIASELQDHKILSLGKAATNDVVVDLSETVPAFHNPIDVVIHAAGKAHIVPRTKEEEESFWKVNYQGTIHLLEGIGQMDTLPKYFVFISTVSVYGLNEGKDINENTPLKGDSPYALSKIKAEEAVENWCKQHGVHYLILRLPLVVGLNPKGNLEKMIRGIRTGRYIRIGRANAQKSMVLGADVARLIASWTAMQAPPSGIYHLTDRHHPTFYHLEEALLCRFGKKHILTIPHWAAVLLGKIGDIFPSLPVNSSTIQKITSPLTFSDDKAVRELGWKPSDVLDFI